MQRKRTFGLRAGSLMDYAFRSSHGLPAEPDGARPPLSCQALGLKDKGGKKLLLAEPADDLSTHEQDATAFLCGDPEISRPGFPRPVDHTAHHSHTQRRCDSAELALHSLCQRNEIHP